MQTESPLAEKHICLRKLIFSSFFQNSYFKMAQKQKATFATTQEILPHLTAVQLQEDQELKAR